MCSSRDGDGMGSTVAMAARRVHGHVGSMGTVVVQGESSPRRAQKEERNDKGMRKSEIIGGHFSTCSYKEPVLKTSEKELKGDI
jgi:hypothetical protein